MPSKAIVWFRQDLRLSDNPALLAASEYDQILPVFVFEDHSSGARPLGAASKCWLHHSLSKLSASIGDKLSCYQGDPADIIPELARQHQVDAVFWNRCYEPWRIKQSQAVRDQLKANDIEYDSFNGALLWEPWENTKADGNPYQVFTPFYQRGCSQAVPPREPLASPSQANYLQTKGCLRIDDLALLPELAWGEQMLQHWAVGEEAAARKLKQFLQKNISQYKEGRDFPSLDAVSRLSPHLHFGEISPQQVWHLAKKLPDNNNVAHFQRELAWREFSYSMLYHFPALPKKNWQDKFDRFPWHQNKQLLDAWQRGLTGYPIVDAGMRELWQTGYMHNRVRMVVASFLVKNCLIDWRQGENWFWDTLVDADLANNCASWQWVAGCGADAAPYFRIFNPVTQGKKFDAQGEYTRRFVPELVKLPDKYLFAPWEAPAEVLQQAGVVLGKTYPEPVVDLRASREQALAAYDEVKGG